MANTKSAKKAIRSSAKKKNLNDTHKRRFREARKAVVDAVVAGDKVAAEKALPKAMKEIDKASKTKVIHKNTASRYKSRLATKVNKLAK